MLNDQQTKHLIKKKAVETGLEPEQLHRLYAIEQLLKKLSTSKELSRHFILKGGYLLTTLLQLENRATADLDWTIHNMKLNQEALEQFKALITSPDEDGIVRFEWVSEQETRVNFLYNGFALRLNYINGKMKTPIFIDMTTGEELLPVKKQAVRLLFEEGTVEFQTYPIEQILADKVITTLTYGSKDDTNSRSKDLYDIYILQKTFPEMKLSDVARAMQTTNSQRELGLDPENYEAIISYLSESPKQKELWARFQRQNSYARALTFEQIFESVKVVTHQLVEIQREQEKLEQENENDFSL